MIHTCRHRYALSCDLLTCLAVGLSCVEVSTDLFGCGLSCVEVSTDLFGGGSVLC